MEGEGARLSKSVKTLINCRKNVLDVFPKKTHFFHRNSGYRKLVLRNAAGGVEAICKCCS